MPRQMKRLAGSNESWGVGGKCRDGYSSAEAESYKFYENLK